MIKNRFMAGCSNNSTDRNIAVGVDSCNQDCKECCQT